MRTPNQIANLRKVFAGMFGSSILFMTSEDVNRMADLIQQKAVEDTIWTWEIKIRTTEDSFKKWNKIEKEPKTPRCSLRTISSKFEELFLKYPKIIAILINAKEDEDFRFEFTSPD